MKPLMKPIDTPDQVFHDGDPSTGELGTICSAEWLNDTQVSIRDIQAECITILKANGFEPDETKRDQLWEAIQAAIKNHVPAASLVGAGIVQLSSSVTSDSEAVAATSKAVKIAMDNGNARMAKDRNGSDIPNKALFRQNLELGNSATRDVGTTTGTVAAGDDVRITGAMQRDRNGSDIPDKAAFCRALGLGALATSDGIDALIKSQNGADIPDKALFVQNLGLKETLNPTKRVSIGNIGTGAFDGSTPSINIGDSDSGFIGSADGVIDIYCNNAKVGYIGNAGLHMLADIFTARSLHAGNATIYTDGNVNGSVWGGRLNDWINNNFNRKNTAGLGGFGWVRDESTGLIMQWGTLGNSNGTYNFPRAFPVSCFAVFVTNTSSQGALVDNAFGYPVNNSQFFAATKASNGAGTGGYPVAWFAIGR